MNNVSVFKEFSDASLHKYTNELCIVQRQQPHVVTFMMYGFLVPTLGTFGLCANLINAIVFMRPKMTASAFSYLAALSSLDCISCLIITLTAFSRSFFFRHPTWIAYDYEWQMGLLGITTGAANLILACMSCDRFMYLHHCSTSLCAPRFCSTKVARYMIIVAIIISIVVNMPFFFVFVSNSNGTCFVTKFYFSMLYKFQNWLSFLLLAILPAIFLLTGNVSIIIIFRRWVRKQQRLFNNGNAKMTQNKSKYQKKLTVTILIVITLYMIGELPAHMTSRKTALNLLFGGDVDKINSLLMSKVEVICISLNALQLSLNIVVYAIINPCFMSEFFKLLKDVSDGCVRLCCPKRKNTVNVSDDQNFILRPIVAKTVQTSIPSWRYGSWSKGSEFAADLHTSKQTRSKKMESCKSLPQLVFTIKVSSCELTT